MSQFIRFVVFAFDHHKEHVVEDHLIKMEAADAEDKAQQKTTSLNYVLSSKPTLSMPSMSFKPRARVNKHLSGMINHTIVLSRSKMKSAPSTMHEPDQH